VAAGCGSGGLMSLISKSCFDQSDDARLAQFNAKLGAISSSSGTSSSPTNPTPNESEI
jgi:hypothetical protein